MPEPLFRLAFDAAALLQEHPPRFEHPHKSRLFEIAYPVGTHPGGTVEVTRWGRRAAEPLTLSEPIATQVQPNYYNYAATSTSPTSVEWHVNFADPRLFVAYGSRLFAQDEMQVAEHPVLASVREALIARNLPAMTVDDTGPTPVLVRNIERRIAVATNPDAAAGRPYGLYGNAFAASRIDVVERATRRIDPPTISNIIAMAAPACGSGEYSEREIDYVLATAITAFSAAREESCRAAGAETRPIIHTGFWGCGAFGGNRRLMIALQTLAARATRFDQLVFHAGDAAAVEEMKRGLTLAETLAARCGSPCPLAKLVGRVALLGLRWGVSDGN
jgi:hypothetical protein